MESITNNKYDYIIIGGGIIGACTAKQLIEKKVGASILLIEKESIAASHQTGRNSGVIHSGVYYPPDSYKANYCQQGNHATKAFCTEHGLPFENCGKIVVASGESEMPELRRLYENGELNGLELHWLNQLELRKKEPEIAAVGGFLVPSTAITDYRKITNKLLDIFRSKGGHVVYNTEVLSANETDTMVTVNCNDRNIEASYVIACAGLHADRIVRMFDIELDFKIIPFKGEYFEITNSAHNQIRHLIYPVPDPTLPFLGIHLTRLLDGTITAGPNAILSLHREGYQKWAWNWVETVDLLRFSGFWKVLIKHKKAGLSELGDSLFKHQYLRKVRQYCPSISKEDLSPHPCGIRAQAVLPNGNLVSDFLFKQTPRSLHVCNAPSPAATCAFPIANHIVKRCQT